MDGAFSADVDDQLRDGPGWGVALSEKLALISREVQIRRNKIMFRSQSKLRQVKSFFEGGERTW